MDEPLESIVDDTTVHIDCAPDTRDENRSPTSGSSSEAFAEESAGKNRKLRRHPRPKRKRKWKPYNELTWDEKRMQDDRESRRAYAKRERLSAEGHPIAPYNTTQFLMDDQKMQRYVNSPTLSLTTDKNVDTKDNTTTTVLTITPCKTEHDVKDHKIAHLIRITSNQSLTGLEQSVTGDLKSSRNDVNSALPNDGGTAEATAAGDTQGGEDIQRYILDDFSHMYAGFHAEQLRSMSKKDLVDECLKLERRNDTLERKVKDCKKKHRYRSDAHLLEKINQLQAQNAQLSKDIAKMKSDEENEEITSTVPVSEHSASTTADD